MALTPDLLAQEEIETFTGNNASSDLGQSVTTGDFDGDGRTDFAIGIPGDNQVLIEFGNPLKAQIVVPSPNAQSGGRFGFAVLAGDLDSDPADELIVGAPGESTNDGQVYVLNDPFTPGGVVGDLSLSPPQVPHPTIPQSNIAAPDGQLGHALAVLDADNDGSNELLASGPYYDDPNDPAFPGTDFDKGYVMIWDSTQPVAATTAWIQPNNSNHKFKFWGRSLAIGNFDGNGGEDIAVGYEYTFVNSGGTFDTIGFRRGSAPSTPFSPSSISGTAVANAGDFSCDGLDDLVVVDNGNLVFWDLGMSSSGFTASPTSVLTVTDAFDYVPDFLSNIGDFNGDGYSDFAARLQVSFNLKVIGGGPANGCAVLPHPSLLGNTLMTWGNAQIESAGGGDINGDGFNDLLVGSTFGNGFAWVLSPVDPSLQSTPDQPSRLWVLNGEISASQNRATTFFIEGAGGASAAGRLVLIALSQSTTPPLPLQDGTNLPLNSQQAPFTFSITTGIQSYVADNLFALDADGLGWGHAFSFAGAPQLPTLHAAAMTYDTAVGQLGLASNAVEIHFVP